MCNGRLGEILVCPDWHNYWNSGRCITVVVLHVTWEEIEEYTNRLAEWARRYKFTDVIAVEKGGLVPGVILANKLNIPLLTVYAKRKIPPCSTLDFQFFKVQGPGCYYLVVDDIIDEGETMRHIARMLRSQRGKFKTTSLLYKKHSKYKPDFYVESVGNKFLVLFPWEVEADEIRRAEEWK